MNKNKKTSQKMIMVTVGLVIVLAILLLLPFVYQQSQKSISMYVNPNFKIDNYNSFYDDTETGFGFLSMDADSLLRENGLKEILHKDEILQNTLYVVIRCTDGFVFPPHIGHFNPRLFVTKTSSFELYNGKTKELLFKLDTWRGAFNYGYMRKEMLDKFKEGLCRAGWKKKQEDLVPESKAP